MTDDSESASTIQINLASVSPDCNHCATFESGQWRELLSLSRTPPRSGNLTCVIGECKQNQAAAPLGLLQMMPGELVSWEMMLESWFMSGLIADDVRSRCSNTTASGNILQWVRSRVDISQAMDISGQDISIALAAGGLAATGQLTTGKRREAKSKNSQRHNNRFCWMKDTAR